MNTKRFKILLPLLGLLLAGVPLSAQGTLGIKYWQTDYSIDGESFGDGPFAYLYYVIEDASGNLIFQVGSGDAGDSDSDVTRTDLAIAFSTSEDALTYGIGLRGIFHEFDAEEIDYYGPEIMLGLSFPVGDTGVVPYVSTSLGYYLYDLTSGGFDESGSIFGYSADAGVAYAQLNYAVKVGYRIQVLGEDSGKLLDDELDGVYLEVSFSW
jgi:hypothetical protein